MTEIENNTVDWTEYRRTKRRLIYLIIGWVPFGILLGEAVPAIFGTYTPSYVLAMIYVLILAFTALQYGLSACPNCGVSYRGRQFYRSTCPKCGVPINK